MKELISRAEVLKILPSTTLWRRCRAGKLHGERFGCRVFYSADEVQALAEERGRRKNKPAVVGSGSLGD